MADLYLQDDAQEILRRAIARQVDSNEVTRQELIEIAREIGIPEADLAWAEQDWLAQKNEQHERSVYDHYRRQELRQHGIKFLIVNIFLIALDLATSPSLGWSLYLLWAWGLLLSLHGWRTYQSDSPRYEAKFQRWRRSRQFKQSIGKLFDRVLGT